MFTLQAFNFWMFWHSVFLCCLLVVVAQISLNMISQMLGIHMKNEQSYFKGYKITSFSYRKSFYPLLFLLLLTSFVKELNLIFGIEFVK